MTKISLRNKHEDKNLQLLLLQLHTGICVIGRQEELLQTCLDNELVLAIQNIYSRNESMVISVPISLQ